jgi:hypothetical protein
MRGAASSAEVLLASWPVIFWPERAWTLWFSKSIRISYGIFAATLFTLPRWK